MGSYNFDTSQITISFLQKASQEDTIEIQNPFKDHYGIG